MGHSDLNPYRSPTQTVASSQSSAGSLSPIIIRCALIGTAVYAPVFVAAIFLLHGRKNLPTALVATGAMIHAVMMILNLSAFLFTIRDWRSRKFPTRRSKWGWLIGFIYTGGICWVWYIFRFGLLHRNRSDSGTSTKPSAKANIQ